ncbi:MAG: arginine decarboxylase, partial [Tolypothrix sp. T3-bin4]|nr:arginine decarboxylase [Tolypothrix sp. T3-bin4]
ALHGKELMSRTLQLADDARTRISQIPGLSILHFPPGSLPPAPCSLLTSSFVALDKTRLTVTVSGLGLTGFEVEESLDELGVTAEFASLQHLTFIISLGNTANDIEQLVQGFITLANHRIKKEKTDLKLPHLIWDDLITVGNCVQMSPREAFFAESETLPILETTERICAEIVCPYPPGIPVLMPGEVISQTALKYLQQIQLIGGFISGCADASLNTLKVVKTKP